MSTPSKTVSFRVPVSVFRELEEHGQRQGMSGNAYARELVQTALDDNDSSRAVENVEAFVEAINSLREDVATTLVALVVEVNKVAPDDRRLDEAEIRNWVARSLC
jgi:hypothetical protein